MGLQELTDRHPDLPTFQAGSAVLILSKLPSMKPHAYTVLNWQVAYLDETQAALRANGIAFNDYSEYGFQQDERLVWTAPDSTRIAWFNDPFGNVLSISQQAQ